MRERKYDSVQKKNSKFYIKMRQDIIFNRKVQFMGTNTISAILMVEK